MRLPRHTIATLMLAACIMAAGGVRAADKDTDYGIPQVRFINEQVAAGWADAGLQPAVAASDGEWCRRVHLDVIGRIPSVDELQAFLADSSPTNKAYLVTRLMGDYYVDE